MDILSSLIKYYDYMNAAGNPQFKLDDGWTLKYVEKSIDIDLDGTFKKIGTIDDKILTPDTKVDRTSNIVPYFMCDKIDYMFGVPSLVNLKEIHKKSPKEKLLEYKKIRDRFQSFKINILENKTIKNSKLYNAVKQFYENFEANFKSIQSVDSEMRLLSACNRNVVFRVIVDGYPKLVTECPGFITDYNESVKNLADPSKMGTCMVTGIYEEIEPLHPKICLPELGYGGKPLISFNSDINQCLNFYGKGGTWICQVGKTATKKYSTALNYIISNKESCLKVGDDTVVYWPQISVEKTDLEIKATTISNISKLTNLVLKSAVSKFFTANSEDVDEQDVVYDCETIEFITSTAETATTVLKKTLTSPKLESGSDIKINCENHISYIKDFLKDNGIDDDFENMNIAFLKIVENDTLTKIFIETVCKNPKLLFELPSILNQIEISDKILYNIAILKPTNARIYLSMHSVNTVRGLSKNIEKFKNDTKYYNTYTKTEATMTIPEILRTINITYDAASKSGGTNAIYKSLYQAMFKAIINGEKYPDLIKKIAMEKVNTLVYSDGNFPSNKFCAILNMFNLNDGYNNFERTE